MTPFVSLYDYKAWANEELFPCVQRLELAGETEALHAAIRILNHVYVVDRIFAANLEGRAPPYPDTNPPGTPTLAALSADVGATDAWYRRYVSALTPAAAAETLDFTFVDGDPGRMTREEMLLHVINHGSYHRGAVGRILVERGIAPPRDVYTRFLRAVEPDRRRRPG